MKNIGIDTTNLESIKFKDLLGMEFKLISKSYEEKLETIINMYDELEYSLTLNKDIDELNLRKSQKNKLIEEEKLIYLELIDLMLR